MEKSDFMFAKTSVFLLAGLRNVWKDACPLHLAVGQAPGREPPGSPALAWLPLPVLPSLLPSAGRFSRIPYVFLLVFLETTF